MDVVWIVAHLCLLSVDALRASWQGAHGLQSMRVRAKELELDEIDREWFATQHFAGCGLTPSDAFEPIDVAALTLRALRSNDSPHPESGTRFLLRFSTDEFLPAGVDDRGALAALARDRRSQYHLLFDGNYEADLEDDLLELGDDAFLNVRFEDEDGELAVRRGWEFQRREAEGCWLTSRWHWHDFRPEFRPGVGQEEWTRICG